MRKGCVLGERDERAERKSRLKNEINSSKKDMELNCIDNNLSSKRCMTNWMQCRVNYCTGDLKV